MVNANDWNAACEACAALIEKMAKKKFWPTAGRDHAALCRSQKKPVPVLVGQDAEPRPDPSGDSPSGSE